jgi:uncharacterized membrane protein YhaH (DUF805 family)
MDSHRENEHVVHPKELIKKKGGGLSGFNNSLAVAITNRVGTMWTAYIFTLLAIVSLPAILTEAFHLTVFPHWLISVGLIALVAWVAQTFLLLVLLPIIIVGQNVIQSHQEAKAETDHKTLTYLANLQEEQMTLLKNQAEMLAYIKKNLTDK